jgi:hypothetical protein
MKERNQWAPFCPTVPQGISVSVCLQRLLSRAPGASLLYSGGGLVVISERESLHGLAALGITRAICFFLRDRIGRKKAGVGCKWVFLRPQGTGFLFLVII